MVPAPASVIITEESALSKLRRVCELLSAPLFSKIIEDGPYGAGAGLMVLAVLSDVFALK